MKNWFSQIFKSFDITKITLITWAIIITGLTASVVALTNQQNSTVSSEIQRYKDDIARLKLSDAQSMEYYAGVREYLQNVVDMNLAILAAIPEWNQVISNSTNTGTNVIVGPDVATQCRGTAPTGTNVIESTSVLGMVGSDTWNYVNNTRWMSTDLGMSCLWTCEPGYTRNEGTWCVKDAQAQCSGTAPTGTNVIKSISVYGMVSNNWSYVENTRWMSADLGLSCQWTCEPGYTRNGNTCVKWWNIISDPKTVYTDRSLTVEKTTYSLGDTLYGYIIGWNKDNLWGCMDIPGGNDCVNNKWWRQLTKPYYDPVSGWTIQDGWQSNLNHDGRVEFQSGFYIAPGFPLGKYTGYTRTWLTGALQSTSFTVIEKVKSCSWGATIGPCDPGVCSTSNIWAQACGGTCACN